jgi:hypothetical protein
MAPFFTGFTRGIGGAGFGKRAVIGKATGGNVSALAPGNGYALPGGFFITNSSCCWWWRWWWKILEEMVEQVQEV